MEGLPPEARIGTSSLRRGAQLLRLRPDLKPVPLRGNVDTRIRRLDAGELDAIILAAAGLNRLGLAGRICHVIPAAILLPAIGQGALGLEVRQDDPETMERVRFMDHAPTRIAVTAERAFLAELEGGCQVPIGGFAHVNGGGVHLQGLVAKPDGSEWVTDSLQGPRERAEDVGRQLARRLLSAGAEKILRDLYSQV